MKNKIDWNDIISAKDASELFNKEVSYFRRLVKEEKITENVDFKKIGPTIAYSKSALEDYFKKRRK